MRWGDSQLGEPLSGRELDVLARIAEGDTDQDAAGVLFLSRWTVRWYVKRILGKLGARNRAHATAIGFRQGLLR